MFTLGLTKYAARYRRPAPPVLQPATPHVPVASCRISNRHLTLHQGYTERKTSDFWHQEMHLPASPSDYSSHLTDSWSDNGSPSCNGTRAFSNVSLKSSYAILLPALTEPIYFQYRVPINWAAKISTTRKENISQVPALNKRIRQRKSRLNNRT
jgi:hypothetical protein